MACGSSEQPNAFVPDPLGTSDSGAPNLGLGDAAADASDPNKPANCDSAAVSRSYLGCEFWPTITYNPFLDNTFDFSVVVANPQAVAVELQLTKGADYSKSVRVDPGQLVKVTLPWVQSLKGVVNEQTGAPLGSVRVDGGAFKLVSSLPVVAYQFNPLEYKAGGSSSPAGKDWSACKNPPNSGQTDCFSYTNDASLLLPTTALTGNYSVYGPPSNSSIPYGGASLAFAAITFTKNNSSVSLKLSATANIRGGVGVSSASAGQTVQLTGNAGDVIQLQSQSASDDLSGTTLRSDSPLQVITGLPCTYMPYTKQACDHIEETLFPQETWGSHYFVVPPTGPKADVPGMLVRLHGSANQTQLRYAPSKPAGCPDVLQPGQTLSCGTFGSESSIVREPFEVTGDHEFAVTTYQLGGQLTDPNYVGLPEGDPSQSQMVSVQQYRTEYTFLTPNDYATSIVDVVSADGVDVILDESTTVSPAVSLSGGMVLRRIVLPNNGDGTHHIRSSKPFGIQVIGYGKNTSYQYPGGLNLAKIASLPIQ